MSLKKFVVFAALSFTLALHAGITTSADIGVTKSAPATALANTDITYDIDIFNAGPDPADTVSLSDPIPIGLTFVSLNQTSGPTFACTDPGVGNNGTVNCTIASLPVTSNAHFQLVVHIPGSALPGDTFTNIATGLVTNSQDDNPENDSQAAATIVASTSADVSITKLGPSGAPANTDVSYSISVTNGGPDDADTVSWTDTLPGTMTFVGFTQNSGPTFTCTPGATTTCSLATMPASSTATFTLTGHIPNGTPSGTTFTNSATVTSKTGDPNPGDNTSSSFLTVNSADLSITKTAPPTATAGGPTFDYTIVWTNNGPDTATNVTMNDPLPTGIEFVSINQNSGPTASCTTPTAGTGGTILCIITPLASGTSLNFTVTVQANASVPNGTISTNTATVSSDTADPNPANNTSTSNTTISATAEVGVSKTAPATATAGTNISYNITVTNSGPSNAASVSLTDTLPAGTSFVSVTQNTGPTFACSGGATVTCTNASLALGSSATFTIVAAINATFSGVLSNTANVSSSTSDSNPANNSSTATTNVTLPTVDLSITKVAAPGPYGTSQPLTYTITVNNLSAAAAAGVSVTDTLPAGSNFVGATPSQGSCSGTGPVTCNLGTLNASSSATVQLTITLPSTTGPTTNTATVSSTNTDSNPANNTALSTVTVVPATNIPAASPGVLLLLALAIAVGGWVTMRR